MITLNNNSQIIVKDYFSTSLKVCEDSKIIALGDLLEWLLTAENFFWKNPVSHRLIYCATPMYVYCVDSSKQAIVEIYGLFLSEQLFHKIKNKECNIEECAVKLWDKEYEKLFDNIDLNKWHLL